MQKKTQEKAKALTSNKSEETKVPRLEINVNIYIYRKKQIKLTNSVPKHGILDRECSKCKTKFMRKPEKEKSPVRQKPHFFESNTSITYSLL